MTKLSLLLKVLEGAPEGALPDFTGNIRCGNALIESDFYDHERLRPDGENQTGVNVFDWRREFSSVFATADGFDAVIGNPPYLDSETMTQFIPGWRDYCVNKYRAAVGNWDVFCVFIERALDLCRPGGYHRFIVPNKLGSANYARSIRAIITGENDLSQIRTTPACRCFRCQFIRSYIQYGNRSETMRSRCGMSAWLTARRARSVRSWLRGWIVPATSVPTGPRGPSSWTSPRPARSSG